MKPFLVVTVDHVRRLAAVRGPEAKRITTLVSPVPPQWSPSARGWVIPAAYAADVQVYVQSQLHEWTLVHNRKQQ